MGYRGLSHDPIPNAILNTYFASVGQKLASNIPPGKKKKIKNNNNNNKIKTKKTKTKKKHFTDCLPITGYNGSFEFKLVHASKIECEMKLTPTIKHVDYTPAQRAY